MVKRYSIIPYYESKLPREISHCHCEHPALQETKQSLYYIFFHLYFAWAKYQNRRASEAALKLLRSLVGGSPPPVAQGDESP